MTRRGDERTIAAALAATLVGMAWIAHAAMGSPPCYFRLLSVQPMVYMEKKLSGEQIPHQAYQAHVVAYPGAAEAHMDAYAEHLFSNRLRALADRDGKTEVWITFDLGHAVVDGAELSNTFRAIYVHHAKGWAPVVLPAGGSARAELE